MKTSIATVSLSGTLGEKLEAIAAAKFDAVEIFENDLVTFSGTPADVRDACRELGLDIVTLQPFRDFEGMPAGQRERAFARAERKFDVMQELGCDLLMICSNVSPDSLGGIDRAAADLRELGERAAKRGLRIAFEALAWGRHINDYRDSWEAVRRADHPAVGLVLDSFHILARGTDLSTIRVDPGRSHLPGPARRRAAAADGLPLLEPALPQLPGPGRPAGARLHEGAAGDRLRRRPVARDLQRPVPRRLGAQRRGRRPSLAALHARPARRPAPVRAPAAARSRSRGVSFIEFSADDHDAPRLEGLLAGLGFRRAGQHRSKAVTRWRQGDINLVVNREKEGFAHSFNLVHGSAVCALGLGVDDAAATFERATLLLDAPFHQAVAPGELDIPAVRGVGGSLLYFLDQTSDARPRLGHRVRADRRAGGERDRPHHASTTSRSRCSTRRC